MQKVVIIIAVLIIAVLAGIFVLRTRSVAGTLTIFRDEGLVQYKSSSGEFVSVTDDETDIPNSTVVKTGPDGLAHVVLPDDSMVSLSFNTEMEIKYDGGSTDIFQTLGNAWFRVQKLAGKNEFTVETPTTVAAVRGTIFGVERGEEEVSYVTDGEIVISQLKEGVKSEERTLKQDRLVKISERGMGVVDEIDIPEEKRITPWFRLNQLINDEFRRGRPRDFIKKLRDREDIKNLREEFKKSKKTLGIGTGLFENLSDWDFSQNGSQLCEIINSSEYQEALNQIQASQGFLGDFGDWLIVTAGKIVDACSDGTISPDESLVLQEQYKNQPEFSVAPQNFVP